MNQETNNVIYLYQNTLQSMGAKNGPAGTLKMALDIVAFARDSGLMIVPHQATPEMVEIARALTGLPDNEIQEIWQAMLQAW